MVKLVVQGELFLALPRSRHITQVSKKKIQGDDGAWLSCAGGASCCELVATVYENDRPSRQVILAKFHDFFVDKWTRQIVAEKFPGIKVDWLAIDRALAQGTAIHSDTFPAIGYSYRRTLFTQVGRRSQRGEQKQRGGLLPRGRKHFNRHESRILLGPIHST